ncbi:MAG TPA: DUF1062 domain-containing protein [Dongiaceae bacterium]|nr:DUF1062 domain-containing protein [Dongiaceae bacterium]
MHESLRVTWRVTLQPPLVRRHCRGCSTEMPFACSMKFRTNAQKKRLDVWLIYRCSACEEVWNLPIYERAAVGDIDAFDAIAHNDAALALRHAFNHMRLRRHGMLEERPDVSVRKSREDGCASTAGAITIDLALAQPCGLRLDRLLSGELGVSRAQLGRLHDAGALRLLPLTRRALRSPIVHGQTIVIDLVPLDRTLAETLRRGALACRKSGGVE